MWCRVSARPRGQGARPRLPFPVEARHPPALWLRCVLRRSAGSGVPGTSRTWGAVDLLCAGVGGEPDPGAVTLGSGQAGVVCPRRSRWQWAGKLSCALGGAGGWLDLGAAKEASGARLAWEPAHLPFPWGIVRGCPRGLASSPGALGSDGGGPAELGRAFVRRPLLGKPPERLCFQAFLVKGLSWSPLTHESCREEEESVVFSPQPTRD